MVPNDCDFWIKTVFAFFLTLNRIFPIKDVPLETDDLSNWLYQRFIEKEDLLSHFYETGTQKPITHIAEVTDSFKMYFRRENHFFNSSNTLKKSKYFCI